MKLYTEDFMKYCNIIFFINATSRETQTTYNPQPVFSTNFEEMRALVGEKFGNASEIVTLKTKFRKDIKE